MIMATGCSNRIAFTQELRQKYSLTKDQLQQLQFYIDGEIILKRKVVSGELDIVKGKLKTESGKLIDEVIVKDETPGILSFGGPYWLAISFEKDETLIFTSRLGTVAAGKYYLGTLGARRINYANNTYITTNDSLGAALEIDKDTLFSIVEKTKILPGRRLEDIRKEKEKRQKLLLEKEKKEKEAKEKEKAKDTEEKETKKEEVKDTKEKEEKK